MSISAAWLMLQWCGRLQGWCLWRCFWLHLPRSSIDVLSVCVWSIASVEGQFNLSSIDYCILDAKCDAWLRDVFDFLFAKRSHIVACNILNNPVALIIRRISIAQCCFGSVAYDRIDVLGDLPFVGINGILIDRSFFSVHFHAEAIVLKQAFGGAYFFVESEIYLISIDCGSGYVWRSEIGIG